MGVFGRPRKAQVTLQDKSPDSEFQIMVDHTYFNEYIHICASISKVWVLDVVLKVSGFEV